jgi:hypothetical protein
MEKKQGFGRKLKAGLLFSISLIILAGCPHNVDDGSNPSNPPAPDIIKLNKNGQPVKNYVYIEVVNTDPRVAMGYQLKDSGKPFFDYVILFSGNLRDRDCANDKPTVKEGANIHINGSDTHSCVKTGVHVHWDGNIEHILKNRDKYIKPLQDRGIKVLLGLLGDWSGVSFSTFGEWPFEDVSPAAGPGHPDADHGAAPPASWANGYPYTDEVRTKWLTELRDEINRYQLDGIDFDDEWASSGPNEYEYIYPNVYPSSLWMYNNQKETYVYYPQNPAGRDKARTIGGANFAKTIIEAREILGPDKIITIYEWSYGRFIPATVEWKGKTVTVSDYYTFSGEAAYGQWLESFISSPNAKYSPVGVDMGGDDQNRARPSAAPDSSTGVTVRMKQHLAGNYGAIDYYCLLDRTRYKGKNDNPRGDKLEDKTEFFNLSRTDTTNIGPEGYLSLISQEIYGEDVVYAGNDYPQDWVKFK